MSRLIPAVGINGAIIGTVKKEKPSWLLDLLGYLIFRFAYQCRLRKQLDYFSQHLRLEHLDLAIGTGSFFHRIYRNRLGCLPENIKISGVDSSEELLEIAHKKLIDDPFITLHHASLYQLPFKNNHFDSCSFANTFHCVGRVHKVLDEIFRVLKPGGICTINILLKPQKNDFFGRIASAINGWGMKKGILYRAYEKAEVENMLLEKGFKLIDEKVYGQNLMVTIYKPKLKTSTMGKFRW